MQEFYDLGFVHLDLKPDNISILQLKSDESDNLDITLKLIDVGMVELFVGFSVENPILESTSRK